MVGCQKQWQGLGCHQENGSGLPPTSFFSNIQNHTLVQNLKDYLRALEIFSAPIEFAIIQRNAMQVFWANSILSELDFCKDLEPVWCQELL